MEDIQALYAHQQITTTENRYAMFARKDLYDKIQVLENVIDINQVKAF